MGPIRQNTELCIVKCHVSIDLLKGLQGLFCDGIRVGTLEGSENVSHMHNPPGFILCLHRMMRYEHISNDKLTTSIGWDLLSMSTTQEKSGLPTIAILPLPDKRKDPCSPSFFATFSTGLCNAYFT